MTSGDKRLRLAIVIAAVLCGLLIVSAVMATISCAAGYTYNCHS